MSTLSSSGTSREQVTGDRKFLLRELSAQLMHAAERRKPVVHRTNDEARFAPDVCLHELVEAQADRTPDACAVDHRGQQVSYQELDRRANRLARYLRQLGSRPETRIAICLEPSIELLVAILGVLKVGSAYVPISAATPLQRMQRILLDTSSPILIAGAALTRRSPELRCQVLPYDTANPEIDGQPSERLLNEAAPDNLAYVIYTSGSTGAPKGVMVTHRGICNTLQWRQATFPFGPTDRMLLTLSFVFDASIYQLFQPLLAGACVVIPNVQLDGDPLRTINAIRQHRITIHGTIPSLLGPLAGSPEFSQCDSLRIVFCGGESLSDDIVESVDTALGIDVHNMYGPTEMSMEATYWTYASGTAVSIGRPIANVQAYVLDQASQLSAPGVSGELHLGGAGVARGYLNEPALTAERFLPDPFASVNGARMYRTGDLCRWLPNGCLEYLGRQDQQVKLHGHRIELGEIEACLKRSAAVREAAVLLREDPPGARRLVAYVVAQDRGAATPERLRQDLGSRLPGYMIPAAFVLVESLPRTVTGKLDRRALPEPPPAHSTGVVQDRSGQPLERFLADLWQELLGTGDIGDQADFFELGGNSITAAILARRLEERLHEFVYTVAVYDAPTIHKLARYLRRNYRQSVLRSFGSDALAGEAPTVDGAVDDSSVAALRELIRTLPDRRDRPVGSKNPSAVFILSPPRSGSTLLRVMLAGHPALFAPPELQLLNYNTLAERQAALSSERDEFWLQGTIRALMELHHCDADKAAEIMKDVGRSGMSVKEFYRYMQELLGDVTLVDKTPNYCLDLKTLRRAEEDFDGARYIHLVRHPSSMIASFEEAKLHVFFPPFLTGRHDFTPAQLAELIWTVCHQNVLEFLGDVPTRRRHVVRFEELVRSPEATTRRLAAFLELPFEAAMSDPYREDRRGLMTDAVHPMARMLGDVKFHQHGRIRAEVAERTKDRHPEAALGNVTRALARTIGYAMPRRSPPALVALQPKGAAPPLFCVHGAGGGVSPYHDLANELGTTQPFYGFRAPVLEEGGPAPESVEKLATAYLRELRAIQPHGPYQLGGWSFGGLVAFEMASQLTASGEEVVLLALFSSYLRRPDIATAPIRSRDVVLGFLREHNLPVGPGGGSSLELTRQALDQAKEADLVPATLGLRDFDRVMARHRRAYQLHLRMARHYSPRSRLDRVVLFEAEDRSSDGRGPFVDWDSVVRQISRHVVAGDHFTMLRRPNIQHLGACLGEYLLPAPAVDRQGCDAPSKVGEP